MRRPTFNTGTNRRGFLRGIGATLALPWMESISHAAGTTAAAKKALESPPVRSAFLFFPNGVVPKHRHAEKAEQFTDSRMLKSLTPHRDELVVLKNLWH